MPFHIAGRASFDDGDVNLTARACTHNTSPSSQAPLMKGMPLRRKGPARPTGAPGDAARPAARRKARLRASWLQRIQDNTYAIHARHYRDRR